MSFFPTRFDRILSGLKKLHTARGAYKKVTGNLALVKKAHKEFNKKNPDSFAIVAKPETRKIMGMVREARNAALLGSRLKQIECPDYARQVDEQFGYWSDAVDKYGVADKRTQTAEKNVRYFLRNWLMDLISADAYQKDAFETLKRQRKFWGDFEGLADGMVMFNEFIIKVDFPDIAGSKATALTDWKDWKEIRSDARIIEKCYMDMVKQVIGWKSRLKRFDKAALAWSKSFEGHVKRAEKEGKKKRK